MDNTAVLRAKMRVESVKRTSVTGGDGDQESISLYSVYAPDGPNAVWAKATPFARLEMTISNPAAFGRLVEGQEIYLDFVPAE